MRLLFVILLLGVMVSPAFSQTENGLITAASLSSAPDTVIQQFKNDLKKSQVPNNSMPNAITVKPAPPVYRGNNGKGFDIYDSRIDNMPILVPDSSFASNMLMPKMGLRNFKSLQDTVPSIKFLGPLNKKQWLPKIYKAPKK